MLLKKIKLKEAVGTKLAHDITEIRPGAFKGPAFRKGHTDSEEDLCRLQRLAQSRSRKLGLYLPVACQRIFVIALQQEILPLDLRTGENPLLEVFEFGIEDGLLTCARPQF